MFRMTAVSIRQTVKIRHWFSKKVNTVQHLSNQHPTIFFPPVKLKCDQNLTFIHSEYRSQSESSTFHIQKLVKSGHLCSEHPISLWHLYHQNLLLCSSLPANRRYCVHDHRVTALANECLTSVRANFDGRHTEFLDDEYKVVIQNFSGTALSLLRSIRTRHLFSKTHRSPAVVQLEYSQILTVVQLTGIPTFTLVQSSFVSHSESGTCLVKVQAGFDIWKFCLVLLRICIFSGLENGQGVEQSEVTVCHSQDWFSFRVSEKRQSLLFHKATQRGSQL